MNNPPLSLARLAGEHLFAPLSIDEPLPPPNDPDAEMGWWATFRRPKPGYVADFAVARASRREGSTRNLSADLICGVNGHVGPLLADPTPTDPNAIAIRCLVHAGGRDWRDCPGPSCPGYRAGPPITLPPLLPLHLTYRHRSLATHPLPPSRRSYGQRGGELDVPRAHDAHRVHRRRPSPRIPVQKRHQRHARFPEVRDERGIRVEYQEGLVAAALRSAGMSSRARSAQQADHVPTCPREQSPSSPPLVAPQWPDLDRASRRSMDRWSMIREATVAPRRAWQSLGA